MRDVALSNGYPNRIGPNHCIVQTGIRHQYHELFTAIAASEIGGANRTFDAFGNRCISNVSRRLFRGGVSLCLIENAVVQK